MVQTKKQSEEVEENIQESTAVEILFRGRQRKQTKAPGNNGINTELIT